MKKLISVSIILLLTSCSSIRKNDNSSFIRDSYNALKSSEKSLIKKKRRRIFINKPPVIPLPKPQNKNLETKVEKADENKSE